MFENKFYRQKKQAKLAGVCAGWAEFTGQDVRFIRFTVLMFALFPLTTMPTVFTYVLLAMALEIAPENTAAMQNLAMELIAIEHRIKSIENYVTSDNFALQCKLWRWGE